MDVINHNGDEGNTGSARTNCNNCSARYGDDDGNGEAMVTAMALAAAARAIAITMDNDYHAGSSNGNSASN